MKYKKLQKYYISTIDFYLEKNNSLSSGYSISSWDENDEYFRGLYCARGDWSNV